MAAWIKVATTYRAIAADVEFKAVREDIRRLGVRRFKRPPPDRVRAVLETIPDVELLRQVLERILEVGNWEELVSSRREYDLNSLARASSTYQAIVEEGRVDEAARLLLRVGEDRFGREASPEQRAVIDLIADKERLEDLVIRACHAGSWCELLGAEVPARQARREQSS